MTRGVHRLPRAIQSRVEAGWPAAPLASAVLCFRGSDGSLAGMKTVKIIVEKNADGYIAYPVGIEGVVVGQGETVEEAMQDVKSALKFHVQTFGPQVLEPEAPALDAFVAETTV